MIHRTFVSALLLVTGCVVEEESVHEDKIADGTTPPVVIDKPLVAAIGGGTPNGQSVDECSSVPLTYKCSADFKCACLDDNGTFQTYVPDEGWNTWSGAYTLRCLITDPNGWAKNLPQKIYDDYSAAAHQQCDSACNIAGYQQYHLHPWGNPVMKCVQI